MNSLSVWTNPDTILVVFSLFVWPLFRSKWPCRSTSPRYGPCIQSSSNGCTFAHGLGTKVSGNSWIDSTLLPTQLKASHHRIELVQHRGMFFVACSVSPHWNSYWVTTIGMSMTLLVVISGDMSPDINEIEIVVSNKFSKNFLRPQWSLPILLSHTPHTPLGWNLSCKVWTTFLLVRAWSYVLPKLKDLIVAAIYGRNLILILDPVSWHRKEILPDDLVSKSIYGLDTRQISI